MRNTICILISLFLLPFAATAQNFETKAWSGKAIMWDDFKGTPPTDTTADFHIELKILKLPVDAVKTTYKTFTLMEKNKSWVKEDAKTEKNLELARTRFYIAHYYARQTEYIYFVLPRKDKHSNEYYNTITNNCAQLINRFDNECRIGDAPEVAEQWRKAIRDSINYNRFRTKYAGVRQNGFGFDFLIDYGQYYGTTTFTNTWGISYSYYYMNQNWFLGLGMSHFWSEKRAMSLKIDQFRLRAGYRIMPQSKLIHIPFVDILMFNMVEMHGWEYRTTEQNFETIHYIYEGWSVPSFSIGYNVQWELNSQIRLYKISSSRITANARITPVFNEGLEGMIFSVGAGINFNWHNFTLNL